MKRVKELFLKITKDRIKKLQYIPSPGVLILMGTAKAVIIFKNVLLKYTCSAIIKDNFIRCGLIPRIFSVRTPVSETVMDRFGSVVVFFLVLNEVVKSDAS